MNCPIWSMAGLSDGLAYGAGGKYYRMSKAETVQGMSVPGHRLGYVMRHFAFRLPSAV